MNKYLKFFSSAFIRGFLAASLFFLVILVCVPIHYETVDDLMAIWTLSGKDGYPAAPFVIFISYALNHAFFYLYGNFPTIPWWGLLIFGAAFTATVLLFSVVFRLGRAACFIFPVLLFFLFYSLESINFTNATLLLEFSVLLCLYEMLLIKKIPVQYPFFYLCLLTACLSLSLLIRWQAAMYFLVFGLIPLLCCARTALVRKIFWVILLPCVVWITDCAIFKATLGSPEKEYLAYNTLIYRINGTSEGLLYPGITEGALLKAGWTLSDYKFLHRWMFYDDSVYSIEKLITFLKVNSVSPLKSWLVYFLSRGLSGGWYLVLALLTLLAMGLAYRRQFSSLAIKERYRILIPLILNIAAIIFFIGHRFVPRIYVPLLIYMIISLQLALRWKIPEIEFSLGDLRRRWEEHYSVWAVAILFSVVGMGSLSYGLWQDHRSNEFVVTSLRNIAAEGHVRVLVELDPLSGFFFEGVHPLSEQILPPGLACFPMAFSINSPRYQKVIHSLGLHSGRDFLHWIVDNDAIGLVIYDREMHGQDSRLFKEVLQGWEEFYRQHFPTLSVQLTLIREFHDLKAGTMRFYRLKSIKNPGKDGLDTAQ